jgi:ribosomal-protein-alanine N-acetyltransferase
MQTHGGPGFVVRAMHESDAVAISAWRYPAEYAFYDAQADPEDLAELLDPNVWGTQYFAADLAGHLAGFFVYKVSSTEINLGLGLRPDLTGSGLGQAFVEAGMRDASDRFGSLPLSLAVAAFNERAITVYSRAGFRPVKRYNHFTNGAQYPFLRMERPPVDT